MGPTQSAMQGEQPECINPRLLQMDGDPEPVQMSIDAFQQIGSWTNGGQHHPGPLTGERGPELADNAAADATHMQVRPHWISDGLGRAQHEGIFGGPSSPPHRSHLIDPDESDFFLEQSPRWRSKLPAREQEPVQQYQRQDARPVPPPIPIIEVGDKPLEWNVAAGPLLSSARSHAGHSMMRGKSAPGPPQTMRPARAQAKASLRLTTPPGAQTSLMSPAAWLEDHPYNPGERWALDSKPAAPGTDYATSRSQTVQIEGYSFPIRGQGPWFCDTEGCAKRHKTWSPMSVLKKHLKSHLPKHERPHYCPDCGQRFRYPKDVKRHVKTVHSGKVFAESECGSNFDGDDNLSRHVNADQISASGPSIVSQLSVVSPALTSVSTFSMSTPSEAAYSQTSPSMAHTSPSITHSSPASISRVSGRSDHTFPPFQPRILLRRHETGVDPVDGLYPTTPESAAMVWSNTH